MNKTAIRNFAVWARNKLIADVSYHAGLLGITKNDISNALPQSTKDVEFYDIGTAEPYAIRGEEIQQRKSLVDAIRAKEKDSNYEIAYNSLMEEVAYTWFNRLIAVRFMEVNDYLPEHVRVLSSESGKQEPDIVTTPFDAELFFAEGEQQKIIQMKNDNKLDEVFRILFIKQCRELSRILPRLFEGTNDYTELLLSLSFIDQEGVVYHLVHDIPEDDFNVEKGGQVEIIGWLYQYYNAEVKDAVISMTTKKAITKEELPAATQLFTTDWVVRYIIDNSLGRYWIKHNHSSLLKNKLEYYIEDNYSESEDRIDPTTLRIIDPCMGSGHFLIYAFEVMMSIYEECGYTQRDAAKEIVENNLFGLDIDDRASQLAYFSVLMKARQYNRRILESDVDCHVYGIQETNGINNDFVELLNEKNRINMNLILESFFDAKQYGSLLSLRISYEDVLALEENINEIMENYEPQNIFDVSHKNVLANSIMPLIDQAKLLTHKYHVVATNPPYLNRYNPKLKDFVFSEYKDFAGDLFSAFMYRNFSLCLSDGYMGYMTPFVWMFIKSYEKLREYIIDNKTISSLIQMEYSAFEEATVPVCTFVLSNAKENTVGTYFKLSEFKGGMSVQDEKIKDALTDLNSCKYVYRTDSNIFKAIPGVPIAFWLSEKFLLTFNKQNISSISESKAGIVSGNDNLFLRYWQEVNYNEISLDATSFENQEEFKWVPINKGGTFRRYYGNLDHIINIYDLWNDESKVNVSVRRSDPDYYFKAALTWSYVTTGKTSFRLVEHTTSATAAPNLFFKSKSDLLYVLALLNSCLTQEYLDLLNPTINLNVTNVSSIPLIVDEDRKRHIIELCEENIRIAKDDWDTCETSWDYSKCPLV